MIATRFAVAVHILVLLAHRSGEVRATSELIADSVNTNPVVVRRITGQLSRAGLVRVRRGPGGADLARPAHEITLGDVWRAVHLPVGRPLFPVHRASADCPVGAAIPALLLPRFSQAERAIELTLDDTRLSDLSRMLHGGSGTREACDAQPAGGH